MPTTLPARIADYAIIGDTRTGALCSHTGSIDWMCLPCFDSEPVFGSLIDAGHGGRFALTPVDVRESSRRYRESSAVLETTWRTATGELQLTEGMVTDVSGRLLPQAVLVRQIRCTDGTASIRVLFDPRHGLPGKPPRTHMCAGALVSEWGSLALTLQSSSDLAVKPGRELSVSLDQGEDLVFVMTVADRGPAVFIAPSAALELLEDTDRWWREWAEGCTFEGAFRADVIRSLITLRLLTFSPSGAPVAALTTSLPEHIGGTRNWDYRYSWPRDASIGLGAFLALGKEDEAHSFMHWLLHASRLSRPQLQVLYTLYGKTSGRENEISNVSGYADSRPVRIGNAASTQHQLDVYGWVLDAGWLLTRSGRRLHAETWRALSSFADFVAKTWARPDAGIWELRGEPAHYVHSKLMGWVALDRALRIAKRRGVSPRRTRFWVYERAKLASEIRAKGFDGDRGRYRRSYGSDDLDAALLILPILDFDDITSERVVGTVDAIHDELSAGDGLLYRYLPGSDNLRGGEGAFLPCSFWLVQAFARLGRKDDAARLLERLLGLANDVGLFAEEIDAATDEHLGNFPQAFTHATLIQAALALSEG
ncbi:MAG: glycoside hydrolase family 15 protein [Actinomycetota bacterium]|nr:glycoside hydrolase family 15 protein [Actinomycetota bacterium]